MKNQMVRFEMDLSNPPPLTAAQRAEIKALRNKPDGEIDYSDIPPLDEKFWKNAIRNPYYKPTKTSTTVRIDSDVLHWLRAHGKGYQSRINAILRREMLTSLRSADPPAPKSPRTSRPQTQSRKRPATRTYKPSTKRSTRSA
jgi:uncharacterized protein (DUF4415 family)